MKTANWILEPGGFIYQANNAGTNVFSFQVQGGIKDDGTRITVEDKEAIARRIITAVNTFDQAREALKDCAIELKKYLDECGDCDHSVGICVCGLKRLIEDVNGITAAMEATHE